MSKIKSKHVLIVGVVTIFAKVMAIFRQIILTYFYGASATSDAYILAQSIPNTIFMLVVSAISISFIPVYSQIKSNDSLKEANDFMSKSINIVLLLATFVIVLSLIFTKSIVLLFASGFDENTLGIAIRFVRISIFSLYFIGVTGILTSYLKVNNRYFSATVIGIVLSLVEIVSCFVASIYNDIILAIGITLATMAQFGIVYYSSYKNGFRWSPQSGLYNKYIKKIIVLSMPVMISYGIDEINVIIDKTIASQFGAGSISALSYSSSIILMIHSIISVSVYTVLFSDVSKLAAQNKIEQISSEINKSMMQVLFLLVPAMFGLITFSQPITTFLFERGNFNHNASIITAGAVVFYAISLIPNGLRMLSQTYFYTYGKTKFCMITGIIAVITNIILNIIFSKIIGLYGLALASSISIVVAAIIHMYQFCKEIPCFDYYRLLKRFTILIVNSIFMSIISYLLFTILKDIIPVMFALVFAILFALIVYVCISFVTKTIDEEMIKGIFKKG